MVRGNGLLKTQIMQVVRVSHDSPEEFYSSFASLPNCTRNFPFWKRTLMDTLQNLIKVGVLSVPQNIFFPNKNIRTTPRKNPRVAFNVLKLVRHEFSLELANTIHNTDCE